MVISIIWMDMEVDNSAKNLESQKSKFVLFQSLEYWSLDFVWPSLLWKGTN